MVRIEDVAQMALEHPEVVEGTTFGNRAWQVRDKTFVWERPFSKADVKRFGTEPVPDGTIVGLRVEDLGEKEAVLARGTKGVFTIPHFDNYPAVLVQLKVVPTKAFRELLLDAWLAVAPPALAGHHLASRSKPKR